MIQRKQSLWLFLASLLGAGVFYFDLYKIHVTTKEGVGTVSALRVGDNYPLLLTALVMCILPLITIFMFKQRKRQMNMTIVSIIATALFIAMGLWQVSVYLKGLVLPTSGGTYGIGLILPAASFVFLLLAIGGISRDEKLVRSVDRLR